MKRTIPRLATLAAAVVGGFALLAVGAMHYSPLCGEETAAEVASPDGAYVAATMVRNCGATTSYVDHVNLRAAKATFYPAFFGGTITTDELVALDTKRGHIGKIEWVGPRRLSIDISGVAPDIHTSSWRDVSIEYPGQRH